LQECFHAFAQKVVSELKSKDGKLPMPHVSFNEAVAVPSDGVAVDGCPYRVQDSCTFKGYVCNDETCNIRAKPATES
jgi:hypothetical protein